MGWSLERNIPPRSGTKRSAKIGRTNPSHFDGENGVCSRSAPPRRRHGRPSLLRLLPPPAPLRPPPPAPSPGAAPSSSASATGRRLIRNRLRDRPPPLVISSHRLPLSSAAAPPRPPVPPPPAPSPGAAPSSSACSLHRVRRLIRRLIRDRPPPLDCSSPRLRARLRLVRDRPPPLVVSSRRLPLDSATATHPSPACSLCHVRRLIRDRPPPLDRSSPRLRARLRLVRDRLRDRPPPLVVSSRRLPLGSAAALPLLRSRRPAPPSPILTCLVLEFGPSGVLSLDSLRATLLAPEAPSGLRSPRMALEGTGVSESLAVSGAPDEASVASSGSGARGSL
ncbi:uncharacterized protein [Oryza sativa Japonica Group]|uniref:uncharacterized protein n=1 Tax=Oryza sativa subsp. japonica TaxID=39947 RepID=UPI00339C2C29